MFNSPALIGRSRMLALVLTGLLLVLGMAGPAHANSKFATIAIDARSGKVLYARNADSHRFPASLTKIMTLYLLFEDLRAGKLDLSTKLKVSPKASRQPPSKLGLKPGRTISVKDAIGALVTKSANDVAVVVAENLEGSVSAFAERMTRKARALGMTKTTFRNPSGLPDDQQKTTARDMATLALRVHRDFPESYKFFSLRSYRYAKRNYRNHNRLLGKVSGVDGIKTGYTRASGFNLTTSTKRNGKRVVAVVLGGKTGRSRNAYMTRLINRMFRTKRLTRGKHLALVAGTPPGYVKPAAGTMTAQASPDPAPMPRAKPDQPSSELAEMANEAAITSLATAPQPQSEAAQDQVTAKPKAFVSVEVPPLQPIDGFARQAVDDTKGQDDMTSVTESKSDMASPLTAALATASLTGPSDTTTATTGDDAGQAGAAGDQQIPDTDDLAEHLKSWNIQIGAFPTREGAESRLDIATHSLQRSIVGKTPFMMPTEKNGKTLYRARISGFDKQSAKQACKTLSRKGLGCFALAPKS